MVVDGDHEHMQYQGRPVKVPLYDSELSEYTDKKNSFQIVHGKSAAVVLHAEDEIEMQQWYVLTNNLARPAFITLIGMESHLLVGAMLL